jgi:O-antigen ligase
MVIGLLLGILAAVLAVRQRRGLVTLSVATTVTLLVALAGTGVGGEVGKRIRSIGDLEGTAKSSSVADREYENQLAVDAIINDPIEGIGLGTSYGAATTDVSGNVVPRKWIHNQYLELWLRTGLAGLLSWLVVLGTSLAYATRWCRRNGNEPPWLGAGVVCAVVAFAASSVAGIYVLSVPSAVAFVGVIALARSLGLESRVTQTVGRPRETSASPRGAFSS